MNIDIWTDIACPFCYLGTAQLDRALERFPHRDSVTVTHHSFQLDPNLSSGDNGSVYEMLSRKYGMSVPTAREANARVVAQAALVGLTYHMDAVVVTNTFDAHRLVHFAASRELQRAMLMRLYSAYFTEGLHVADRSVLASLAVDAGLDHDDAVAVLSGTAYTAEVEIDIRRAGQLGIRGVPFFVVDEKYGLSGAQGETVFTEMLNRIWQETGSESASVREQNG